MDFCILCKEIVEKRYSINVEDMQLKNKISSFICRDCYNRFVESNSNKGFFKLTKLAGWVLSKKRDMWRRYIS